MPPPPRRNRRKHRLRVPCSECHCPNNFPTKPKNNPSKHTLPSHPLVRSKSAVVRSLCRKMRTPFTRSHTVDENMLRYYSPETSEYSVCEGLLLKPESLTGTAKKRIPEIYIEDCLQVNFNDRLVDKFRSRHLSPYEFNFGSHRRSRSWQDRSTRSKKTRYLRFLENLNKSSRDFGYRKSDIRNNLARQRRSFLLSRANSFDYDVIHNGRLTPDDGCELGFLSRKVKSFDNNAFSNNIFSDDSLRTAREKLKKNLCLNDSYGERIPALKDQSKSYYDSQEDEARIKQLAIKQIAYDQFTASQEQQRRFYGYDSDLSAGETEIYVPAQNASRFSTIHSFSNNPFLDRHAFGREDTSKRKYTESIYQDVDSKYRKKSPEKKTRSLGDDIYSPFETNEHIYCSIDEVTMPYREYEYKLDPSEGFLWKRTSLEDLHYDEFRDDEFERSRNQRRRTKSTDSCLEGYNYETWNPKYDRDYYYQDEINKEYYDPNETYYRYPVYDRRKSSPVKKHRNSYFETEPYSYYSDCPTNRDSINFNSVEYENIPPSPRHRRNISPEVSSSYYESLPIREDVVTIAKDNLNVPSFRQSKKIMKARAESTPDLNLDEDFLFKGQNNPKMYKRKRNSSCPETLRTFDSPPTNEDSSSNLLFYSDEDFGSMDTVIHRNYISRGDYVDQALESDKNSQYNNYGRNDNYIRDDSYRRDENYRDNWQNDKRSCDNDWIEFGYHRRKNSCPECREMMLGDKTRESSYMETVRRNSAEARHRHRRRNSSCPETRELEFLDKKGGKRNVAISDTLEYYEYSMESESQCSENCGFGSSDPRRTRNRAPRPGNANSNLFDSQTATSDTAKNPRATVDHHENPTSRNHTKPQLAASNTPIVGESYEPSDSSRQRSRKQSTTHDYHDDDRHYDGNNRRSSSMPESSDYASQSGSYEKTSRHQAPENEHNGHSKRGQFTRSFSNTDAPPDEKVGTYIF